jgi:hypothetical protein
MECLKDYMIFIIAAVVFIVLWVTLITIGNPFRNLPPPKQDYNKFKPLKKNNKSVTKPTQEWLHNRAETEVKTPSPKSGLNKILRK